MARMIDTKPFYNGEAILWEKLQAFLPASTIVYNNREINGREFDYCVFLENAGALIIEVKGWKSEDVTVHGVDDILINGYTSSQRSPKKQARAYRFALLNRINVKYNCSPLIFDMVCYPFISREAFYQTRLDIVSEESFTIFKEDLDNSEMFLQKIQKAYEASKKIPHSDFTHDFIFKLRNEHADRTY